MNVAVLLVAGGLVWLAGELGLRWLWRRRERSLWLSPEQVYDRTERHR